MNKKDKKTIDKYRRKLDELRLKLYGLEKNLDNLQEILTIKSSIYILSKEIIKLL